MSRIPSPSSIPSTPRRVRGPSPQKTERTRSDILSAAIGEFRDVGIEKATMAKIAQRAGLAKGTLYLHFDSKEALLLGALQETVDESVLSILNTPRLAGESVRRYIERLVLPRMATLQTSGRMDLTQLMLEEARTYPALVQYYREHVFVPWHRFFLKLLQTAADEGELRGITPEAASLLLGSPVWFTVARDIVMGSESLVGSNPVELMQAQINAIFGVGR